MTDFKAFITYSLLTTGKYSDNAKTHRHIMEDVLDCVSGYSSFFDEFIVRIRFIIDKRRGYSYFKAR